MGTEGFRDRFGLVLVLIVFALLANTLRSDSLVWSALLVLLEGAILVLALAASGARRWMLAGALAVAVVAFLATLAAPLTGSTSLLSDTGGMITALLVALAPVVIAWRLLQHTSVTRNTVAGALCIYLLVGLFFAVVYGLADGILGAPVFAGDLTGAYVDYIYFSFVTMTTVGYGDITPVSDLVRMLAVTQALLGQLYLVTVVALLIGRVQPRKRTS